MPKSQSELTARCKCILLFRLCVQLWYNVQLYTHSQMGTVAYSVCTHVFGTSRNVLSLLFTSSNIKFLLQSAAKRKGERGQRVTGRGGGGRATFAG